MKFKHLLVQLLGILTTLLSIVLIYLILFKDGHLQALSTAVIVELIIVLSISTSTKFFWYTSTEDSIRRSESYIAKRNIVTKAIGDNVKDAVNFDKFIDNENIENYNTYVSSKCQHLTVSNYRLSLFDRLHRIIYKRDKSYYLTRYIYKVERRAGRIHKLSGSCIRSLTQSAYGLTDDRNNANSRKMMFLLTGILWSFMLTFITASVAFTDKTDIDMTQAMLKMTIYTSNILFSILQAVLKARMTVADEDIAYFNKILAILDKYVSFNADPKFVTRVSYSPKEVVNDNNCAEKKSPDINTSK